VPVRRTGAYRQKKSTGIVANTVANVIAALLTYQCLCSSWPSFAVLYWITDLSRLLTTSSGHAHWELRTTQKDFWGRFLVGGVQWEWLWIDANGKNGYYGNEFPSIDNHWGVMAAWSRKTLKIIFCKSK